MGKPTGWCSFFFGTILLGARCRLSYFLAVLVTIPAITPMTLYSLPYSSSSLGVDYGNMTLWPPTSLKRLHPSDRIGEILNNRRIIDITNVNGRNRYVWECCVCGHITQGEYANLKKRNEESPWMLRKFISIRRQQP